LLLGGCGFLRFYGLLTPGLFQRAHVKNLPADKNSKRQRNGKYEVFILFHGSLERAHTKIGSTPHEVGHTIVSGAL